MSALSLDDVLARLEQIEPEQTLQDAAADQVPEARLAVVECRHCGARYWHHLGHLADGGKIWGGPCCFGHKVLTVSKYPTEEAASAAWGKWHGARSLPAPEKRDSGEMVAPR